MPKKACGHTVLPDTKIGRKSQNGCDIFGDLQTLWQTFQFFKDFIFDRFRDFLFMASFMKLII